MTFYNLFHYGWLCYILPSELFGLVYMFLRIIRNSYEEN